jgi:hypothetical protein
VGRSPALISIGVGGERTAIKMEAARDRSFGIPRGPHDAAGPAAARQRVRLAGLQLVDANEVEITERRP